SGRGELARDARYAPRLRARARRQLQAGRSLPVAGPLVRTADPLCQRLEKRMRFAHAMPFGAEIRADGAVRFRLGAPAAGRVELLVKRSPDADAQALPMTRGPGGFHELITTRARAGSRYRYRIDESIEVPDPASRANPDDVHGASEVVDPRAFDWDDVGWAGRPWPGGVVYELHVGTFRREGSFRAAIERLPYLVALGVTAIELMPVADFPGSRNWGYDAVLPFAPDASYGTPEDLKALVQAVHR